MYELKNVSNVFVAHKLSWDGHLRPGITENRFLEPVQETFVSDHSSKILVLNWQRGPINLILQKIWLLIRP